MYIQKQLVELLSEMFGLPRKYTHSQQNVPFCCPRCDNGTKKYNLEVNVSKGVFHCWSCGYKGKLIRLFYDYGQSRQLTIVQALPIFDKKSNNLVVSATPGPKSTDEKRISIGPHRSLSVSWNDSIHYLAAKQYLKNRGINDYLISKWDISYSEHGPNKFRIIIPSRSEDGKLEYYIARSFYDYVKPKYKNPPVPKQQIIFGESFIDWNRTVVITEGVFDSIVALNAVPILGTEIHSHKKLISKIKKYNTPVIVCLDYDAWNKSKDIYKILCDFDIDVSIAKVPKEYGDLSSAFRTGGKRAILDILDSAHRMTWEESLW